MNKLKYIFITLILLVNYSYSFMSVDDSGTAAGSFLKLGAGARAAGLGEAYSAVAGSANSVYWNPAGLNAVRDLNICLMHSVWFAGLNYEWVAGAIRLDEKSAFGIGLQYMGYGDIVKTDDTGLNTGSFTPTDMAVIGSFGTELEGFKIGFSVKNLTLTIINTATAVSFDAGIMKEIKLDNNTLMLSVAGYNLSGGIKYIDDTTGLPFILRFGTAYFMGDSFLLACDVTAPSDGKLYAAAGLEYQLKLSKEFIIMLRGGYNTKTLDTLGSMSGMAAGGGIKYGDLQVDYAYKPYGDLGTTHRFSVAMDLGELLPEEERKLRKKNEERKIEELKAANKEVTTESPASKKEDLKEVKKEITKELNEVKKEVTVENAAPKKKVKRIIRKVKQADGSTKYLTITPDEPK